MKQELLNAITRNLDKNFIGINIHTEPVEQGFLTPCFTAEVIKTEEKLFLSNRYKLFNRVLIKYYPKNGIEENNKILNSLYEKMKKIDFEKGIIIGENIEGFIEKGIVKFYIDYDFYIFRKEDTEKMEKMILGGEYGY